MTQTVDQIDIGALFGPAGAARAACDAALWAGLRRTGAVIITGYPDADQVDQRARSGLALFDAPDAVRRPLTSRHNVA